MENDLCFHLPTSMIMLILNHPLLLHLSSVVLGGRGTQKSESCLPVGTVYLGVSRIYVYDQDCSLTVKSTFAINRKLIFFLFFVRWGGRRFWRRYVTVRGLWYSFMCKYLNYCTMNLVLNHFQPQQVGYVQQYRTDTECCLRLTVGTVCINCHYCLLTIICSQWSVRFARTHSCMTVQ